MAEQDAPQSAVRQRHEREAVPAGPGWFIGSGADAAVPADVRSRLSQPLILLGQHSLPTFCAGVLLSLLCWAAFFRFGGTLGVQVLANTGGFAAMVAVAWLFGLSTRRRVLSSPNVLETAAPRDQNPEVPNLART